METNGISYHARYLQFSLELLSAKEIFPLKTVQSNGDIVSGQTH